MKQRKSACSTCPWIVDGDRSCHFDPQTLKKTIVDTMRSGHVQSCHSADSYMCSGSLAFAEKTLPKGVFSLNMVRIAARLGMFDHKKINKKLNVFSSVTAMLKDHKDRAAGKQ